ncbi:MAG: DNA polymerase III subunit delta [Gammaproteobacteria bacterium]|nr:DNA polymerase III subunit delta [Gammaproteobacteria bacterium]
MKITLEQLPGQLKQTLAPIYLITGDEPLLVEESSLYLRKVAAQQGFSDRKFLAVTPSFNWQETLYDSQHLDLFHDKTILELQLNSDKLGRSGGEILQKYAQQPTVDTLLILRCGKIDSATQKTKWFTAIETNGVVLQIWPITRAQLPSWLQRRLQRSHLQLENASIELLADFVEGNLLAAKQIITKLNLMYGEGVITPEQVQTVLIDSAQFDIFALVDSCLRFDTPRALNIFSHLTADNTAPVLILWALIKDIRILAQVAFAKQQNKNINDLWLKLGVWKQRQTLLQQHLKNFTYAQYLKLLTLGGEIDCMVKGANPGNSEQSLQQLIIEFSRLK